MIDWLRFHCRKRHSARYMSSWIIGLEPLKKCMHGCNSQLILHTNAGYPVTTHYWMIDCVYIAGKDGPSHIRVPWATGNRDASISHLRLHLNAGYPVTTWYYMIDWLRFHCRKRRTVTYSSSWIIWIAATRGMHGCNSQLILHTNAVYPVTT